VIIKGLGSDDPGRKSTDKLARNLLDKLADPFYVQGHEVFMTASMGIAYYPEDAPNVIDLIRNADAALYNAKNSGGNVFSYYMPAMNEMAVERLMTKSKLKRAFERDELLVHYQPKYNLETGEVFGAEALVRWELPERGLILPSDFIPIAEETNLIIEIGEWVLDKVCEDFRFWQRSVSSPGRVSVNLSLKQLRQPNFIARINSILRGHEVSPTSLELEITETTLMENPDRTIKLLNELYALGLHLAIDDFGTGYSSLSALQQFPISTLKIDKSFVRDVASNPEDATIVGTIIQMGRNLNMDVVAEGVENEDQLNFLQRLECTYVQGLLFGDPISSDNYVELLLAQAEGTDSYRALFA
jgi:EAL domain-containing protein (putative c-di-GMP-specific phosphodiesterase class I)